jgi:flotillin
MLRQLASYGLLAAHDSGTPAFPAAYVAVAAVVTAVLFFSLLLLLTKQYKRCPPNRLLVIFGKTSSGGPVVVHGGAVFVVPLLQDYAYLSLEPIDVELSLSSKSGTGSLGFAVPHKFTVAISTVPALAQAAAVRLLGSSATEIKSRAEEIIGSALGRTIEAATESCVDRDAFYTKLESEIGSGLKTLGLELVSLKRA